MLIFIFTFYVVAIKCCARRTIANISIWFHLPSLFAVLLKCCIFAITKTTLMLYSCYYPHNLRGLVVSCMRHFYNVFFCLLILSEIRHLLNSQIRIKPCRKWVQRKMFQRVVYQYILESIQKLCLDNNVVGIQNVL